MRIVFFSRFVSGIAAAQTPRGNLVRRVTDPSHAGVPGATIQVRNVNTNDSRAAQSQADGEYTVSNLPPGTYEVIVDKSGFRRLHESNLELQVEQTARLDAQLQIGTTSETVEVRADVPLLNTETSSRGDVITSTEITEMPLNGRDFNDLAFLVAGVQPADQGGKGSPYVANGARADASNVLIDGLNDENPRDAGAQARPPLDSLQEFKFQTSGYSAEYGPLPAALVTMVLTSAGNHLHGPLLKYLRNDLFDPRNFFDARKIELRRNQFRPTLPRPLIIPTLHHRLHTTLHFLT